MLIITLFSHDAQGGMYKQSGVTLIGTDCEVFASRAPTLRVRSSSGVRSDGKNFWLYWDLNQGPFALEPKTLTTACATLLNHAILICTEFIPLIALRLGS